MYSSIPDGFRKINAAEGLKGFTLVSNTPLKTHSPLDIPDDTRSMSGLPHPQTVSGV